MAKPSVYRHARRLTLILTTFVLVLNLSTAVLYQRLPDDPFHLGAHLTAYSYFASFLSVLGVVGARRGNGALVAIFANYLLIDVIICTIPRLLAMSLFPEIRTLICSADSIHAWMHSPQFLSSSRSFTLPSAEEEEIARWIMQRQCRRVVSVLQIIIAVLAIGATVVQVLLALRVSAHAKMLQRQEWRNSSIDETSLSDDEQVTPVILKISEKDRYRDELPYADEKQG